MTISLRAFVCAFIVAPSFAMADGTEPIDPTFTDRQTYSTRPDAHAPLSIMGDHMHRTGEIMISMRQMRMTMSSNKIGTDKVSDARILNVQNSNGGMFSTLKAVPRKMVMDMTMLGVMYAPNDRVTLASMVHLRTNEMTVTAYNPAGVSLGDFKTRSDGLGDTSISALIAVPTNRGGSLHAGLGFRLPTGSIKETGLMQTPMNMWVEARLPYGIQLGSGTYDFTPSLTYQKYVGEFSWGAQWGSIIRLGKNSQGYRLGDHHQFDLWGARRLSASWSVSTHLNLTSTQKINGQDRLIDKPIQTAQTAFYGGERANFGMGVNWIGRNGPLKGHRFAAEVLGPIYEDLNGPQMALDWSLMVGYQKAF